MPRMRVASARSARPDGVGVGELVLLEAVPDALEDRLRRLHADVGGEEHLLDLLDDRRVDLLLAGEELRQLAEEALVAPRFRQPLAEAGDVPLMGCGFRSFGRGRGRTRCSTGRGRDIGGRCLCGVSRRRPRGYFRFCGRGGDRLLLGRRDLFGLACVALTNLLRPSLRAKEDDEDGNKYDDGEDDRGDHAAWRSVSGRAL